jgi:hypothetical protein
MGIQMSDLRRSIVFRRYQNVAKHGVKSIQRRKFRCEVVTTSKTKATKVKSLGFYNCPPMQNQLSPSLWSTNRMKKIRVSKCFE